MWMWVCDVAVRLPPNRMWWKEYPSHYVGRQTTRAPILAYPLDDVRGLDHIRQQRQMLAVLLESGDRQHRHDAALQDVR